MMKTPVGSFLRVLIVEDQPARTYVLQNLYRDHAWIVAATAARAIRLVHAFDFDLISLDFDLAGPGDGEAVAIAIRASRNAAAQVVVHSMNAPGAARIQAHLPAAVALPIGWITARNARFKHVRSQLARGLPIDWEQVRRELAAEPEGGAR